MGCGGGGLIGYILLAYALWEVKVLERSGLFLMQPNCATWCQHWQQMLESEDRLSGASRQRFQPVGEETSSWRWNIWFGSHWGGGATFVGVRRCDIKRWDNAPASTVKSHNPLYWYWYKEYSKTWQSKQCYPKLSIQIEKQRSTVYEKFHCANSTRLLNILSRSFSKYHIWRIVFVAFVKVKSLLKVNTRTQLPHLYLYSWKRKIFLMSFAKIFH